MSRIGKLPIEIPASVQITVDGNTVIVKGPKGELSYTHPEGVKVSQETGLIQVERLDDSKPSRSYHGLVRTLVANMVHGVVHAFQKKLEIIGVGYRAEMQGNDITFNLGYSHPIHFPAPEGITLSVEKQKNHIVTVEGINKELVGQVAAKIRKFRKPEPYKGKGIRYIDEVVLRKEGKKAGSK